jgi:hypothetical protein
MQIERRFMSVTDRLAGGTRSIIQAVVWRCPPARLRVPCGAPRIQVIVDAWALIDEFRQPARPPQVAM